MHRAFAPAAFLVALAILAALLVQSLRRAAYTPTSRSTPSRLTNSCRSNASRRLLLYRRLMDIRLAQPIPFRRNISRVDTATLMRLALGIVFLWFGALKFFPGMSPAEALAAKTIGMLTFGIVPASVSVPLLALWESTIGVGLLFGLNARVFVVMLLVEMPGTMLPLLFFPHDTFSRSFVPTLEGQYIIKNLVLIAGAVGLLVGKDSREALG